MKLNCSVIDMIIVPVREELIVLPVTDWANGQAGFNVFEWIGVGSAK